jgi:hypothetical protein
MLKPRILLLTFILLLSFAWLTTTGVWKVSIAHSGCNVPSERVLPTTALQKMQQKAGLAKQFVKNKSYNTNICFLIDMSLSSGQNRFFVYDLAKDSILKNGLVTHGRCNEVWLEGRKYGNVKGCGCSSLGKYRIGNAYIGKFGLAYKLHGLEKTNDKAFERFVVLHSHECVPDAEIAGDICQSDGCPTVSSDFLNEIRPILNTSKKPVLLWIYE